MSRLFRGRKILQGLLHDYAVEQGIISAATAAGEAADPEAPVDIAAYGAGGGKGQGDAS